MKAATDKSRKWIHALNLQPRIHLTQQDLIQCDPPVTSSPFTSMKRPQMNQHNAIGFNDEMIKRLERDSQMNQQPNYRYAMPQPKQQNQSSCWFCLAAPSVEKQLIVRYGMITAIIHSIGTYSYIACPKGQLTDGHILIIPIYHRQNTLQLEKEVLDEIDQFKKALIQFILLIVVHRVECSIPKEKLFFYGKET